MVKEHCPQENEGCSYFDEGCYADTHHLYWPSTDYKGMVPHQFRTHTEHIEIVCRDEHDQIHEGSPPDIPSMREMADFLLDHSTSHRYRKQIMREVREYERP